MGLDFVNLIHFAFRLGPFLMISFFILSSFFNQDIKCIIYIVGIVVACTFAVLVGNTISLFDFPNPVKDTMSQCHVVTLGETGPLSKIPLSTVIYTFTSIYLSFPLTKILQNFFSTNTEKKTSILNNNNLYDPNKKFIRGLNTDLSVFILFPLLIVIDSVWLIHYNCFNVYSVLFAVVIGICVGFSWSYMISSSGKLPFHYFSIMGGGKMCERPSGTTFKCSSRNFVDLSPEQILAMYGKDSPQFKKYLQELEEKENVNKSKDERILYYVQPDGTVYQLYDGDTLKCNDKNKIGNYYRLEISGNSTGILHDYQFTTDQKIIESWDPAYTQTAKTIFDCNNFQTGDNMELNTNFSDEQITKCKETGIGCTSSDMLNNNTIIGCMNINPNGSIGTGDKSYSMPIQKFLFKNDIPNDTTLFHPIQTDVVYNSWNGSKGVTEIQIEDCSKMSGFTQNGTSAPMNTSLDNDNIVKPDNASIGDSIRCITGEGGSDNMSKMSSKATDMSKKLGPKGSSTDNKNSFTIYRVMEDYSLRGYPDDDPVVPLSWNDKYMNISQTYKDCSQFTFGPVLTINTNNPDNSIEYIKGVINNIARYLEIYNLTNLNDISGNMVTLKNDLDMMLLGKLKTGIWGKNDLMLVNQDIAKVKDDLNSKNTAYATNLSKEISDEIQSMIFNVQDNMWKPFKNAKIYNYRDGKGLIMREDTWIVHMGPDEGNHTWTWIYDEDADFLKDTYNKNDDIKAGYKSGRLRNDQTGTCLSDGDNGDDHWASMTVCTDPKTRMHLFSGGPNTEATGDHVNTLKNSIILQSDSGRCINFGSRGTKGNFQGCNFVFTDELLLDANRKY